MANTTETVEDKSSTLEPYADFRNANYNWPESGPHGNVAATTTKFLTEFLSEGKQRTQPEYLS